MTKKEPAVTATAKPSPTQLTEDEAAEAADAVSARKWNHIAFATFALLTAIFVLVFTLSTSPVLRATAGVSMFFAGLFLMGTIMWVMALQAERKRGRKSRRKSSVGRS